MVCRNPLVAEERARKREALLEATERELSGIARRVGQGTLAGEAEIGLAAGAVWNRYRVKNHFRLEIADTSFSFQRKTEQIEAEAALDGIHVLLRTSVPDEQLGSAEVVRSYKQIKEVERAFRSFKGPRRAGKSSLQIADSESDACLAVDRGCARPCVGGVSDRPAVRVRRPRDGRRGQ